MEPRSPKPSVEQLAEELRRLEDLYMATLKAHQSAAAALSQVASDRANARDALRSRLEDQLNVRLI